jgi:hypothetical protein
MIGTARETFGCVIATADATMHFVIESMLRTWKKGTGERFPQIRCKFRETKLFTQLFKFCEICVRDIDRIPFGCGEKLSKN